MAGRITSKSLFWRIVLAVGVAAATVCLLQNLHLPAEARQKKLENAASQPAHHYAILIDLDENTLSLLENGRLVHRYPCATGKSTTPSPVGYFKITRKSLWGEGFGGYFIGLNVPWGIYGIHGTTDPNSVGLYASHGCFRMLDADIRELYGTVSRGTPVLVVSGVYGAFGHGFRMISPGMYGQDVLLVQRQLQHLGYFSGECNGQYDTDVLRQSIHRFQQEYGLPVSDSISRKMMAELGFTQIE